MNHQTIDRGHIIAIVDKTPITSQELNWRFRQVMHMLGTKKKPHLSDQKIRSQILETMITEQVQLHYAQENNITVSEKEVDQAIQQITEERKITKKELLAHWLKMGAPLSELRKELRRKLLLKKTRENALKDIIHITNEQLINFIQKHKDDQDTRIEFQHIFIKHDRTMEQIKKARETSQKIINAFHSGRNFDSLVHEFSQAPDVKNQGIIGWRSLTSFPEPIQRSLKKIPVGDISKPIETGAGLDILFIRNKKLAPSPFSENKDVLLQIIALSSSEKGLSPEKALKRIRKKIASGQLSFERAAQFLSSKASVRKEDASSHWISTQKLQPVLKNMVNSLEKDGLSPVFLDHGQWYLLRFSDERIHSMPLEKQKLLAQQMILNQYGNERFDNWIQYRKKGSYIKIVDPTLQ